MFLTFAFLLAQPPATQTPPSATPPPPVSMVVPQSPVLSAYPTSVGGKSLNEWIKDLGENKDAAIRELAVKAIPMFGPSAREPSLRPLVRACREDGDPGVRVNAIITLGSIGATNKEEAKLIIDAMKIAINTSSVGGVIRLHASRTIGHYGASFTDQANDAIPTLTNIVKDPSWETRKSIAYSLGRIGGPTKNKPEPAKPGSPLLPPQPVDPKTGPDHNVLKTLQGMLNDSSATVRLEAAEALVLLGPPAVNPEQYSTTVTPMMVTILDRMKVEKDKGVLIWLNMVIMRLDGNSFNDQTITKIVDLGRAPETDPAIQGLTALSLLGEKAIPHAVPFARDMLRHPEGVVIAAAASYFRGIGLAAKPSLPQLEAAKAEAKDEMLKQIIMQAIQSANGTLPAAPPPPPKTPAVPKK